MASAIECREVTKRYGHTTVVQEVDLRIAEGTVHALVGANGAGKSTLLGMLSGRVSPTRGKVEVFGSTVRPGRPQDARKAGLTAVYQELTVLPALTAVENVFLGQELQRAGLLSERAMRERFLRLRDEFQVDINPAAKGGSLSVASAQMLEIMRAVQADARVILFDEPTAALSQRERAGFLELVERLRARGLTIVLVSHNLGEVLQVSDEITVMAAGRKVAHGPAADWDRESLVKAMTGEELAHRPSQRGVAIGDVVLRAKGIALPGAIAGIDLAVRRGEVLGLAGLVGSGRTSVLRALAGAESRARGSVEVKGSSRSVPRSVRQGISLGMGLVPEERKTQGLHQLLSVPDNVTVVRLGRVSRFGFIDPKRQLAVAREWLSRLALSREVGFYPVGHLSGGNQQKVAVAKWLFADSEVLLIDEPTRGIDVAAKADVLDAIRQAADDGKAVIMTSSEIEEVLQISDRVLVLSEGSVVEEIDLHASSPTVGDILKRAFHVKGQNK